MRKARPILFLLGILLAIGLGSCVPDTDLGGGFEASDLVGTWQEGTVHEKYLAGGTGFTWDTADDVSEEEASEFEWTLEDDQLIQKHIMFGGQVVPRILTITKLTSFELVYEDTGGVSHYFIKVTHL